MKARPMAATWALTIVGACSPRLVGGGPPAGAEGEPAGSPQVGSDQQPGAGPTETPGAGAPAAGDGGGGPRPPRVAPTCTPPPTPGAYQVRVTTSGGLVNGRPFTARGTTCMNFSNELVRRGDFVPRPDPATVAMLAALRPAYLRFVPGHDGQLYLWRRDATIDPLTSKYVLSPALLDAFIAMCRAVGADPFVAINFKTGTAEQAGDLVRYLNVEHQAGVKWFQIGNEPDLPTEQGLPNPAPLLHTTANQDADLEVFASRYQEFVAAMRAVDPGIRLVAPEMMMGQDLFGFDGAPVPYPAWLTPIMRRLGDKIDAISWHYYAKYSGQKPPSSIFVDPDHPENLLQENAPDWPTGGMNYVNKNMPALRAARDATNKAAEVWVDEFAEDPGTRYNGQFLSERVVAALWAADLLGRFAEQGTDVNCRFLFKGKEEHFYALVATDNSPRPAFGTYWLYAQVMGESWVQVDQGSPGDQISVAAHAAIHSSDGSLTVVLVNKTTQAVGVDLNLADFVPFSARRYTLAGAGYSAKEVDLNGQRLTQALVAGGLGAIAPEAARPCPRSTVEVPPTSVVFLSFSRL